MGIGFSDIKFHAIKHDVQSVSELNTAPVFVARATRFKAPQWLLDIKFFNTGIKVTQKPEYTEAKMTVRLPADKLNISLGEDGIPIVDKIEIPDWELNLDFKIRSNGYGEFKAETALDVGNLDAGKVEVGAEVKLHTSGTLQLPWYGEGMSLEGEFGGGLEGEIKYEESLLVLVPALGQAVLVLGNVPGLNEILNAIYVEGKVEPEIGLSTGIEAGFTDSTLEWKGLTFDGKATVTLTVGLKIIEDVAEANVYGGGEIAPEFCLSPHVAWKKTEGAMFVGAEVKAFSLFEANVEKRWGFETSNPDVNCEVGITSILTQPTADMDITRTEEEVTDWHIESPEYGTSPYAQFNGSSTMPILHNGNFPLSEISDSLVVSNLYKSASPALAMQGDKGVLVWIHDDLTLNDTQSKELMASTWQGSGWSAPAQITNNEFVDFNVQLAFLDEQHVLAVWQQIEDSSIPDDATLTPDIGKKVELVYSIYNMQVGTWSPPSYLTNNNSLDHRLRILVGQDGFVMTTWIQNPAGQLMGDLTAPDQFRYAVWNGNSWSEGAVSSSDISALLSYDAALYQADQGVLVFSRDTNDDFTSRNDAELIYSQWDGAAWSAFVPLTQNMLLDESPSVSFTSTGEKRLLWLQGNQLVMLADDWVVVPVSTQMESKGYVLRGFKSAVDDEDNIAVIWQGVSETGNDLFYSLYDSQTQSWLLAEQLTNSLAVEKQLYPSFDGSGQLMIAYALDNVAPETVVVDGIPINNVMQYQSTDLHVLHYTPDSDLSIRSLSMPYRPNPEPGETVTLQALLVNSGDWSIENPSMSFYDGNPDLGGTLIETYNHSGFIKAGESIKVSVQWTVPLETSAPKAIYAVVDELDLISEEDETNNVSSLTTVLPELSISSVSTYYYDQFTVIPLAVIYNNGKLKAENVVVEFREGSEDGLVVYSETVPLIEKEGMVAVSTEIDVSGWVSGSYKYYVTIDSADSIQEMDESNNSDYFSISILPDLVIYAGDITATLDPDTGGTVDVTVRNWGTSNATNVQVNLYEGPDIDTTRTPISSWVIPLITVDGQVTVSATIDHIPNHLFAVADPPNDFAEIDESNNVGYELLPIVYGSQVLVVGSSDPNLEDIIVTYSDFEAESGRFIQEIQGLLYDVTQLGQVSNLCDISAVEGSTELQGKIALVEKGNCEYAVQVNNATALGAIAVLIYNDAAGGNHREVIGGGIVSIPGGFLPRQDGLDLMAHHNETIEVKSEAEATTILDPYQ